MTEDIENPNTINDLYISIFVKKVSLRKKKWELEQQTHNLNEKGWQLFAHSFPRDFYICYEFITLEEKKFLYSLFLIFVFCCFFLTKIPFGLTICLFLGEQQVVVCKWPEVRAKDPAETVKMWGHVSDFEEPENLMD